MYRHDWLKMLISVNRISWGKCEKVVEGPSVMPKIPWWWQHSGPWMG